ncbi:hypothetical protein BD414DRAFT_502991, partial [Trametes punicea]
MALLHILCICCIDYIAEQLYIMPDPPLSVLCQWADTIGISIETCARVVYQLLNDPLQVAVTAHNNHTFAMHDAKGGTEQLGDKFDGSHTCQDGHQTLLYTTSPPPNILAFDGPHSKLGGKQSQYFDVTAFDTGFATYIPGETYLLPSSPPFDVPSSTFGPM